MKWENKLGLSFITFMEQFYYILCAAAEQ